MAATERLQVGDPAPDFELPAFPEGEPVRLSAFRGKPVVLYFYPRDMTPGCTTEACDFRDANPALKQAGAVVLGVSPDSVATHQKFAEKYELPFTLLADEDHAVCTQYGVWVEKNMYGKKSWGVQRATFLIGADGSIEGVWPRVKVAGHVAAVLEKLNTLAK